MAYPQAIPLTNPGFETGNNTGWAAIFGGAGPLVKASGVDTVSHSGSWYGSIPQGSSQLIWWGQSVALDVSLYTDVDAGSLIATVSTWRKGFATGGDSGALVIECLDGGGNWLAERVSPFTNPQTNWVQESAAVLLPPTTRTLRVGMRGWRIAGTECDAYHDDWTLSIDKVAIPHRVIDTAKGNSTAGWTVTSGAITVATVNYGLSAFGGSTAADVIAYKDVALPSDLQVAVDLGLATLRTFYQLGDKQFDNTDRARFWIECKNGAGAVLGTLQNAATPQTPTEPMRGFDQSLAIPALTRSFRLNWRSEYVVGATSDGVFGRMTTLITANANLGRRRRLING